MLAVSEYCIISDIRPHSGDKSQRTASCT